MGSDANQKQSLGKGLEALLGDNFDKSLLNSSKERVELISVDHISAGKHQPRRNFNEDELKELADSIKQHGIIQPLIITPADNGKYSIIAGERRLRSAKIAGLKTVPAIIRSTKELEQLEIALIENVQRVDLTPLEQAFSINRLHEQFSLSFIDIAKKLGKASSTVNNIARLLQLPDNAQKALQENKISEGHARAILSLKGDSKRQEYLLNSIIEYGWNVRQAERFVVSIKSGVKTSNKAKERSELENSLTKQLSSKLGTQVLVRRMANGGRLEITFKNDDELNRIINLFK